MNFKKDLQKNILPFWLGSAIDYENGGIYTQLDEKGAIYGTFLYYSKTPLFEQSTGLVSLATKYSVY